MINDPTKKQNKKKKNLGKVWQSNFECVTSVIIFEVTYLISTCCALNHQNFKWSAGKISLILSFNVEKDLQIFKFKIRENIGQIQIIVIFIAFLWEKFQKKTHRLDVKYGLPFR